MPIPGKSLLARFLAAAFSGKHALLGNTVSGCGLFVLGDLIEQRLERRYFDGGGKSRLDSSGEGGSAPAPSSVDWSRVGRLGAIGVFESPPHFFFYGWLDRKYPGKSWRAIRRKILLDQTIACPAFAFLFLVGVAAMEGRGPRECLNEFTAKFPTIMLVDWCLWPPCQLLNFLFVPARFRLLYVNSVTVLWNVFLSHVKHN